MSRKEKIVWYIIWVLGIAVVSFLVTIEVAGQGLRIWPVALLVSWATVCLQLPLLLLLRQRAKRLSGEATTDEREKMIRRNANEWSANTFITICMAACLILLLICKHQGKEVITIRVEWLGWFIAVSALVVTTSMTIIIRILRGRGTKHGQD